MEKQIKPLSLLTSKDYGQKGFTLIELIMVIVILGILAAVAVPKYQSLKQDASDAAANGVYSGAQAACAINFAHNMLHPGDPMITDGTSLISAMADIPPEWVVDPSDSNSITISGTNYKITVTPETATTQAKLSKGWVPQTSGS